MIAKLTLDLPEDVARVRKARRMAVCLLEGEPVAPQEVEDMELVIGEICANVVRHAHSREGRYRVILELFADRLGVTVADQGRGFDPAHAPPPGTDRPDTMSGGRRLGGLGLPLARALTDRLVFRASDPTGTTVYAEKVFRSRGIDAPLTRVRQGTELPQGKVQREKSEGAAKPEDPGGLIYDCVSGPLSIAVYECSDGPPDAADAADYIDDTGKTADTPAAEDACRFEIYVNGKPVATTASQMEAEQEARRLAEQGSRS